MELLRRYSWECTRVWRGLFRTAKAYLASQILVVGMALALVLSVFALIDGVLLRELPYRSPDELYLVQGGRSQKSYREIEAWANALPNAQIAGHQQPFIAGYTRGTAPVAIRAAAVTESFLPVLGVRPQLGGFAPEDFSGSDGPAHVLISDGLRRNQFGADANVVGRTLDLAGATDHQRRSVREFRIAGVLPPGFVFPSGRFNVDVLVALSLRPEQRGNRSEAALAGLLRLPSRQLETEAEAVLTALARAQGVLPPVQAAPTVGIQLNPLDHTLRSFQRTHAKVIGILAAALLLLAFVNSAALSFARTQTLASEMRTRAALGASASDQWRLAVWHTLLVTVLAVAVGTLTGYGVIGLLGDMVPAQVVLLGTPELSWRALVAAVCATAVFAVLTVTALRAAANSATGYMSTTATRRRGKVMATVTGLQAAFSCIVIVGGVVFVGSVWRAWQEDAGFRHADSTLVELSLAKAEPQARSEQLKAAVDSLSGLGDYHAGAVAVSVLGDVGGLLSSAFERPHGALDGEEHLIPYYGDVFDALGVELIQGRLPTHQESRTVLPIVVVSQTAAKRLWPDSAAVGKTLTGAGRTVEVIGVVADARYIGLDRPSEGEIYQVGTGSHVATLVFGGGQGAWADTETVLRRVASSAPQGEVLRIGPLKDALARSIRLRSFRAWIFGGFSLCGLVLTCIGIVGTVLMSSGTRTREMAIRLALGSTRWGLFALLAREPMLALTAGIAAGSLLANWAIHYAKAYIYGISASDPRIWVAAALTIFTCALIATLLPGVKVTRVDPVAALRE